MSVERKSAHERADQTKPDDTRERIIETAEALFRRLGFAKTAVADIAGELRMSPANVYRFFSSKNAIVEAICQALSEVDEKAWAVARSKAPAAQRMERLILEILAYHKENLITEQARQRHRAGRDGEQLGHHPRAQGSHAHRRRVDPARRHRGRRVRAGRSARDRELIMRSADRFHASACGRPMPGGRRRPRSRGPRIGPLPAARHHPPS